MRILMNLKKLLLPLACGILSMTVACSSSDPAPNQASSEENEKNKSSESDEKKGSSDAVESAVKLSPDADKGVADTKYKKWLEGHYVTMEDEAKYYTEWAVDFPTVFKGYSPVGRVIWSAQADLASCKVTTVDQSKRAMKFRGCTVSEGIGYGMLISYFQGDEKIYKSLWNYSKGFRKYFNVKLMPWITSSFRYNKVDNSSATDADLDIATSLILQYYKTGDKAYLNDALTFVNAIWDTEIQQSTKLILSGNTATWKNDPTFNLSYFSPVALRLFAKVDTKHDWKGVLDAMYKYMKKVQDAGTGVFPDWSDASGNAKKPPNGSADKSYWLFDKESVRIPWRIAWDYYWYQDDRAKAILQKLNDFIVKKSNGDPTNVAALSKSYSWNTSVGADGDVRNLISDENLSMWCATGIIGNEKWLKACTKELNSRKLGNSTSSYFSDILQMMYTQLLNGAYAMPSKAK